MMDEASLRLALRITARISLLFFVGAFAARGARALWGSSITAWLDRNANRLLVGLAASHTLHLAGIAALAAMLGQRFVQEITWTGIILGGVVYVLIYALAIPGFAPNKEFGLLSSQRFRSVAFYVIWFVFAVAFIGGSFRSLWPHLPFAVLTFAALLVRVLGNWRSRGHSLSVTAG